MMVFQFVGIQIFSLMYLILVLVIYSSKKRFKSAENDIFKVLLIFTIFELLLDIVTSYFIKYNSVFYNVTPYLCKTLMAGYQIWTAILMQYVLLLPSSKSYKSLKDLFSKNFIYQICVIIVFLLAFFIFLIPTSYVYDIKYNISYITGLSTVYNYAVSVIYLLIILISILYNRDKIPFSKRLPIVIFLITSVIFLPLQRFNADVPVLIVPLMSYAIMIMYFTLENPDLKLINELNELKKQTEEASSLKTKIFDNVSYNMKTPMNTIVSLSGMLMLQDLPLEVYNDIKSINSASKVLLEMVDNTLDISKIETGMGKINNDRYNLKDLVRKLYFETVHLINEEKVKFILSVDENIPCNLYGDYDKLTRALGNVLANAAKYTNVGKISFSINGNVYKDKVQLIFTISDTGIGIEKKDFDKIFGKFNRIENNDTKFIEGTGLGLPLSKQIIELLGGKISFDSTYGAGTKFIVELSEEIQNNEPIGKIDLTDSSSGKLKKIKGSLYKALIIESNKHDMNVLGRMLTYYDIKLDYVLPRKDKINTFDSFINTKYDMIFVDKKVLNDDVVNLIGKLKDKDTILIGLSPDGFDCSRNYFYEKGFNECILKPIDILMLDKILNKYFK